MKSGFQNKSNMLVMNILIWNDDLDSSFGPTIEEVSNFMKFGTKNKWNIGIYIRRYSLPGLWANCS